MCEIVAHFRRLYRAPSRTFSNPPHFQMSQRINSPAARTTFPPHPAFSTLASSASEATISGHCQTPEPTHFRPLLPILYRTNTVILTMYCVFASFVTYFGVFAFRKAVFAHTYEHVGGWFGSGLSFKTAISLMQSIGLLISNLTGIRYVCVFVFINVCAGLLVECQEIICEQPASFC